MREEIFTACPKAKKEAGREGPEREGERLTRSGGDDLVGGRVGQMRLARNVEGVMGQEAPCWRCRAHDHHFPFSRPVCAWDASQRVRLGALIGRLPAHHPLAWVSHLSICLAAARCSGSDPP